MTPPAGGATDGRGRPRTIASGTLLRNALINLGGQVAPLVVAVVTIPLFIQGLGTERFGLLALVWVAIGYFGFLDLGLSRALTQMVASRVAEGRAHEVRSLVRTGIMLMALLAITGTVVLLLLADPIARGVLRVPAELHDEAVGAVRLLAISLPAVIASAGYRGALEAFHRFGLVNAIKVPGSIVAFAGPAAILPFSNHLVPIVAVLVASRVAVLVAYRLAYRRLAPPGSSRFAPELARQLFAFGSWMTVSNVVSPLMVYVDRFLIGAFLSISAVAYYVTPHEVVTKLLVLPGAVAAVFFPAFSGEADGTADPGRTVRLGVKTVVAALFPAVLAAVMFADEGLTLWVGAEFAAEGATVLRLLAIGVLINAAGQILFAFVQGRGRPDITAKLHLLELPVYMLMIAAFLPLWGIEGAALAWTLRVALDTILLWVVAVRISPLRAGSLHLVGTGGIAAGLILGGAVLVTGLTAKIIAFVAAMIVFGGIFWWLGLDAGDRARLRVMRDRLVAARSG
jgi:O-antigen/teichoic acid export membrane protein